jgi:hypothetical protein
VCRVLGGIGLILSVGGFLRPSFDFGRPEFPTDTRPLRGGPRHRLLDKPGSIVASYDYPPLTTRHSMIWQGGVGQWQFRCDHTQASFSGVTFKRAYDLSKIRDRLFLSCKWRPSRIAAHYKVALLDDTASPGPVMVELPLADRVTGSDAARGWVYVVAPLKDFPDEGIVLESPDAAEPAGTGTFDWSRVKGIRFGTLGESDTRVSVTVKDLEFGPTPEAYTPVP